MTIGEAYINFLNIVEKNSTNNNLDIDRARFIEWFNFTNNKYQERALNLRNDDSIREMAPFLKEVSLTKKTSKEQYDLFLKPQDYFDFSNLAITAKKDKCKASDFVMDEVKTENVHIYLADNNLKPSYKARETFYHLMEDSVAIYHIGDFKIEKAKMKYYQKIPKVDIEGYVRLDNTMSTNIDPVTEEKTTVKILQLMATYFLSSDGDLQKFQAEQINFNR